MEFWEEVKRDVQKGMREGMALVKAGASIAVKKMDELTVEGKKRFQAFDLKTKVHAEVAELGARMYQLARDGKVAINDVRARKLFKRIQKLEAEISGVEASAKKSKKTKRKSASKKKGTVQKKTATRKKTAPKRSTATRKKTAVGRTSNKKTEKASK